MRWKPDTPPLSGAGVGRLLEEHEVVAVHFWAVWDLHDRAMDQAVAEVRERFFGRVHFVGCDVDDPANVAFASRFNVSAIPNLGLFRRGGARPFFVVGARGPDELERILVGFSGGEVVGPVASIWRYPPNRCLWPDWGASFRRWRLSRELKRRRSR